MLRFTKQVDYGLMAMQYIAEHHGDAPVGVKRIADQFGIPVERLAKVLQRLAKGGLMVAQSGPRGGYRLTLPPSAVTVGQVIRVLEGPLAIVSCMAQHGDCVQAAHCTLRNPAERLQAAITDLLDTMTLAELAGDEVPAALAAQR
jgi:Rrf2 family transcriptional regulator, cysteine metabolism repressor